MTIYDLAKKAGVSTATVSRVVNKKGGVKRVTEERVIRVLEENNYTVNDVARSLAVRSTKTIAMLATDIREFYYVQLAYYIDRGMAPKEYYSLFGSMGRDSRRQVNYIRAMISKRVSAIVFIGSPARDSELISGLLEASRSVPLIITNGMIPGENIYCIQRDDAAGIRSCIDHLVGRGCLRLALVSDFCFTSDYIKQSVFQEYIGSFADGGVTGETLSVRQGLNASLELAHELYGQGLSYDGLICTNDIIAAGLVRGIGERGLRVGSDVKVTGFDNNDVTKVTTPSITSVDSDLERQGAIAVDLLTRLCAHEQPAQHSFLITPTLIVRESSGGK